MCEECGAPGNQCEERFHEMLARELEDQGYGRVHHLTVSTYMLQHSSKLTREGWLYERDLLREFLLGRKTPEDIRNETKHDVDGRRRTFKIKTRTGRPSVPQTEWSRTILDVRMENAEVYCEDVTAWARETLKDSEGVIIPPPARESH